MTDLRPLLRELAIVARGIDWSEVRWALADLRCNLLGHSWTLVQLHDGRSPTTVEVCRRSGCGVYRFPGEIGMGRAFEARESYRRRKRLGR